MSAIPEAIPTALSLIEGCVDTLAHDGIHGWALDRAHPGEPLRILILHQGRLVAEGHAGQFRQDLIDAGHSHGHHGFVIPLPASLPSLPGLRLHVHEAATGTELPQSPLIHETPQTFDADARHALAAAVDAGLAQARTAQDLDDLATFLLQQFDRAFAHRQALADGAAARRAAFDTLLTGRSLSTLLEDTALATLDRFPPLHFPDAAPPDVSVIIPVHNHFAATHRCLTSLLHHLPTTSMEIILVDDASTDETIFAGPLLSGAVRLHRLARNEGFVAASNAGAALARGRLLLFLNNDTVATPGWLDALADTFADPSIGIAGAKLLAPDGRLAECGGILYRNGDAQNWGRGEDPARPEFCFRRRADYVSGAALMLPRPLWDELGGFDPAFAPGYYEDTDLCFRTRAHGRAVVVQPLAQLVHHEGTTSGTDERGSGMKRFQPINRRRFLARWSAEIARAPAPGDRNVASHQSTRRALFIDECVPTPDQDAGSWAAIEHMRSLQRLGYAVSFAASDRLEYAPDYTARLQREGVQCFYAPYHRSIEEVLRGATAPYDLVYLHRLANATRYTALIRERMPGARILYNVADLHHLRTSRQAAVERDPALLEDAARLREAELAAIRAADGVLTHSEAEAILVRTLVPETPVTVLPWTVHPTPVRHPFASRAGLAFIGGFRHQPNVDAALHLARDIMPLVWQRLPGLTLHLVGSNMPDSLRRLQNPRIRPRGYLPDLDDLFAEIRLTVAPLRYGAGLKGKVLASLAAAIPCALSPTAAEGIELPDPLTAYIASTPETLADAIIALHEDPLANRAAAEAGLAWIAGHCSPARVDTLLRTACETPPPAPR